MLDSTFVTHLISCASPELVVRSVRTPAEPGFPTERIDGWRPTSAWNGVPGCRTRCSTATERLSTRGSVVSHWYGTALV